MIRKLFHFAETARCYRPQRNRECIPQVKTTTESSFEEGTGIDSAEPNSMHEGIYKVYIFQ